MTHRHPQGPGVPDVCPDHAEHLRETLAKLTVPADPTRLQRLAARVRAEAKRRVPRQTGRLR